MFLGLELGPTGLHKLAINLCCWSFGPTKVVVAWIPPLSVAGHLVPAASLSWLLAVPGSEQSTLLTWGGLAAGPPKGKPLSLTPRPSPLQAREELRPVREDFEAKNKQLLEEMPKFYSSRIDYFKPSFEALVRAQVRPCPCPGCPRWHPPCLWYPQCWLPLQQLEGSLGWFRWTCLLPGA